MATATFPHPIDGLPVRRTFTAQARAILPTAVLADPDHPWLRRQEAKLPRGVLGVIYHRDGVELVSPTGVSRRPFQGQIDFSPRQEPAAAAKPARSPQQIAAADRTRAWKAANRDKVRAQHERQARRRRAERDQLHEAAAATNRAM